MPGLSPGFLRPEHELSARLRALQRRSVAPSRNQIYFAFDYSFGPGSNPEQALFRSSWRPARKKGSSSWTSSTAGRDPEEERRRNFDLFYSAARGDRGRGTGLGLAIVRGLIGAHQGRVEALAGPGGTGTTIRVTLPLLEPPENQAAGASGRA